MVVGFESFSRWFQGYAGQYAIIGGTACSLLMDYEGIAFRATKDIDLVLIVEALTPEFGERFWEYILAAGYQHRNKNTGVSQSYRFSHPENQGYPYMLELFSRKPDVIELPKDAGLTPLPLGEGLSSLSAILLDDDYYALVKKGIKTVEGIAVLDAGYLIILKAKAWIDLVHRRNGGEQIDSRDIKKHKNDVFRLSELLSADTQIYINVPVHQDMEAFIKSMREEIVDVSQLGIKQRTKDDILRTFEAIYILDEKETSP